MTHKPPDTITLLGVECKYEPKNSSEKEGQRFISNYSGERGALHIGACYSQGNTFDHWAAPHRYTWCGMISIHLHNHPVLWEKPRALTTKASPQSGNSRRSCARSSRTSEESWPTWEEP